MDKETAILFERISDLKRTVFSLEWDLPNIKNNEVKAQKQVRLGQFKAELEGLMQKAGLSVNSLMKKEETEDEDDIQEG